MVSMLSFALFSLLSCPQGGPAESLLDIVDLKQPADVVLEVGGLAPVGKDLLVTTRRGEVWLVRDAYGSEPRYQLWAEGLQEPLGLLEHEGWFYTAQRGELSRMRDTNGDGRMDELRTVSSGWPLSGNYHEYCFGPALAGDGTMWMTWNKPFGDEPFGFANFRGWAARVQKDGTWEGACAGLRSPAGVGTAPWGEVFYTDNQGEWCATSKFAALAEGDFHGHPHGIESCKLPQSRVQHPGEVKSGLRMEVAAATIPSFRLPAVWIPYDRLGRSPAGFVWDDAGRFGPYKGQVLCGDQWSAEVFRMSLEKVNGRWQGACYPFRKGLKCGITRLAWGTDGSLWCGLTNRGWGSLGKSMDGIQRLVWKGAETFDLLEVTARKGGFALRFSHPVDPSSVAAQSVTVARWTYDHHAGYGCPERDNTDLAVTAARLSADGMVVELDVDGMKPVWVHHLVCKGIRAKGDVKGTPAEAFYTLNAMPE